MQIHNHNTYMYSYIPYLLNKQQKERGPLEVEHIHSKVSLVGWLATNVDLVCDDSALASKIWTIFIV